MQAIKTRILAAWLCLAVLCGCAAKNNTDGSTETSAYPDTENLTPDTGAQTDTGFEIPEADISVSSGENEEASFTALTEEELALLSETDLWLELDAFRLRRSFVNEYLSAHFNIPAEKAAVLPDTAMPGIYLEQFDAWYTAHGDIAFYPYELDRGIRYGNGTIELFYFNEFLSIAGDNGETDYIEAPMVITLVSREDGTWYVAAHEVVS